MSERSFQRFRREAELILVVLVWGINFVVIKIVLEVMHPHVLNVFRLFSAAAVLGYIHYRRTGRSLSAFWKPFKTDPRAFIVLTFLGWVFYQMAFITGLDLTSAENAAIIMSSAPIWTALLVMIIGVERLSGLAWLGLAVSIIGTGTVITIGSEEISISSELMLGNGVMLLAAMMWGSYTAITRPLVKRHSPLALTVLALILALPFMVALAVPFWSEVNWPQVTGLYWIAIIFSGALSTGVAIVFWNNAVRTLGASHTAAFGNLVPLVALVSGYFILDDRILPAQIAGGSLIILGLVIMRYARRQRTESGGTHT
jgi:drug/metabolite transporter (DMT)-like permease